MGTSTPFKLNKMGDNKETLEDEEEELSYLLVEVFRLQFQHDGSVVLDLLCSDLHTQTHSESLLDSHNYLNIVFIVIEMGPSQTQQNMTFSLTLVIP